MKVGKSLLNKTLNSGQKITKKKITNKPVFLQLSNIQCAYFSSSSSPCHRVCVQLEHFIYKHYN